MTALPRWRRRSAERGIARSMASCWTSAFRRRRWTTPRADSASAMDGPLDMRMDTTRGISAAEWLATATEQQWKRWYGNMGKNGLLFRLQRRLLLAGQSSQFQAHDSLPRSWQTRSRPAKRARIRQPVPFRLSGFSSIKSLKTSKLGLSGAYAMLRPGRAHVRDQLPFAGRPHGQAIPGQQSQGRRSRTAACRSARSTCRSRR